MDIEEVRAAYDAEVRRRPEGEGPQVVAERADGVVRVVAPTPGWRGVVWSALDPAGADAAIAAQVRRFAGERWEWKHHDHDAPPDLPARLRAAGLVAEPPETVMVAELAALDLEVRAPPGVHLMPVTDPAGIEALVRFYDDVFGGNHTAIGLELAAGFEHRPEANRAWLAVARGVPVGAGRLVLPEGTAFASLWGGGVAPAWRGRGVFRALVAHRAALAEAAGYRFLHVDASSESRPILRRLGFAELGTATPFVHEGAPGPGRAAAPG